MPDLTQLVGFVAAPATSSALLLVAERKGGARTLWITAGLLALAFGIVMTARSWPFSETSPLTVLFLAVGPVGLAALVLRATFRLQHRPMVRGVVAAVAFGGSIVPFYILSCIIGESTRYGCFF